MLWTSCHCLYLRVSKTIPTLCIQLYFTISVTVTGPSAFWFFYNFRQNCCFYTSPKMLRRTKHENCIFRLTAVCCFANDVVSCAIIARNYFSTRRSTGSNVIVCNKSHMKPCRNRHARLPRGETTELGLESYSSMSSESWVRNIY